MKEIAEEQSLRATGTVVEVDHPTRGKYLTVGNPIKLSDSIPRCAALAAARRAHRRDPDQVLGYSAEDVAEIKASGALPRRKSQPRPKRRSQSRVTGRREGRRSAAGRLMQRWLQVPARIAPPRFARAASGHGTPAE